MSVDNDNDITGNNDHYKIVCPNCNNEIIFDEALALAKNNGITTNSVMCPVCYGTFAVNLTPSNNEGMAKTSLKQMKSEDEESVFSVLFYEKDENGENRISKTKTISILVFIGVFILTAMITYNEIKPFINVESIFFILVVSLIISVVLAAITYIIGLFIGYVID